MPVILRIGAQLISTVVSKLGCGGAPGGEGCCSVCPEMGPDRDLKKSGWQFWDLLSFTLALSFLC